jgi:hypothetical protein
VSPAKFALVDNFVTFADNFGTRKEVFNGVDLTATARVRDLYVFGGLSTGRTMLDNCQVIDSPDLRFCKVTPAFLTHYRAQVSYPLPWQFKVGATFQSLPGPQILATYAARTADIAPSLGRNLAGGTQTARVELIEPGTMYGDRTYLTDFRVSRMVTAGRVRIEPELNIYNLLNASSALSINTTYGPQWLRPNALLLGRFAKAGLRITF